MAIGLLTVVLTALAGTLIATLGAVSESEREVIATQLASELAEEIQIGDFEYVALYEGETSADPGWDDRLDSFTTFEGRELVQVSGPSGARDERYPEPVLTETRGNVEYRIERYITWTDRGGDGDVDTKRQTVFVSWTATDGESRELRFDSERVPGRSDPFAIGSDADVISFRFYPDPVELNEEGSSNEGRLTETVKIEVRTSEGTTNASLQLYAYAPDSNRFVLIEPDVNFGVEAKPSGTGWVTWTATLSLSDNNVFANGLVDVLFQASDIHGDPVTALGTLDTFGGPYDLYTPTPDGTDSGEDEVPTVNEDPAPLPEAGSGDTVDITVVHQPPRICVDSSNNNLTADLPFRVRVNGLTEEDGGVDLSYPYYTNSDAQNPDDIADDAMDFVAGTDPAEYETTIAAGSKNFRVGDSVTFGIDADRAAGAYADDRDRITFDLTVEEC